MKCPRCDIETDDESCPQCGLALSRVFEQFPGLSSQAPLQFSVSSKTKRPVSTADWRSELRRKLRKYARRKGKGLPEDPAGAGQEKQERDASAPRPESRLKSAGQAKTTKAPSPQIDEKAAAPQEQGLERPLFKYRLEDVEKEPRRKIVTFDKSKPERSPLDKPLIRKPVKPQPATKSSGPKQKNLTLEVVASAIAAPPPTGEESAGGKPQSAEPEVSGEILFSRVLGAIIDLLIAGAAGFLFSYIAARLLGSDFPSSESLILAAATGLLFLFFDAVFFLYTLGATPGMSSTDLKVVEEDGREVTLRTALLRTALSFLVTITVVGLVWAVFDPSRRCWHDRLSGTVVVPGASSSSPQPKTPEP